MQFHSRNWRYDFRKFHFQHLGELSLDASLALFKLAHYIVCSEG